MPVSHSSAPHAGGSSHDGAGPAAAATHHPHHLKYGAITTSGFAPGELQAHEHEHLDEPARRRLLRDRTSELIDAEARRIHSQRRYLFRKPRPLQYFRGTTLVRDDSERASGRLELFFDLTFVGIIAVLAEEVIAEPTGSSLVRYLITYTTAFYVWTFMREIFNAFYKDDLSQRMLVLTVMAALVVFGNNATLVNLPYTESPARAAAVGAYLIAEGAIFFTCFMYSFHVKAYRLQLRASCLGWVITAALYIGAIFVSTRAAIAMSVVAIFIEWAVWCTVYSPWFKRKMKLAYSSGLNIEHEVERFNDFITLVMGEFLYSVFKGSPAGLGMHLSTLRAVLAVAVAFCFQLFYMQGASSKAFVHPIRHSVRTVIPWFTLHLPIVSALTLCGDSMADLTKEQFVPQAIRWITCGTYAIGMLGMWALAMLEQETDMPGELWVRKNLRLLPRLAAGFVAIFLPLTPQGGEPEHGEEGPVHLVRLLRRAVEEGAGSAGEASPEGAASGFTAASLDSTRLLAVLAGMSLLVLLWEMISSLDGPNAPHESAHEGLLAAIDTGHTSTHVLQTPAWRGFPTIAEPGCATVDRSHQRSHGDDEVVCEWHRTVSGPAEGQDTPRKPTPGHAV
ncbi:hypothetical protein FA09DRAFT_358177 [Tilletiopsis washingtonensis]|uniref:Low temperature requirement A n=1 Tax=Tilletiopsis washingtonensis TaxID=58919 RepID=A0A316ZGD2_9BASI|nr:hypothetical protein FA09DRAFT_358177 [Tilletiopsis washingtonensis]PWO00818.1 hypothetical protein FA09DRAFT_358177 [Tilletiopsis washingtonensis]